MTYYPGYIAPEEQLKKWFLKNWFLVTIICLIIIFMVYLSYLDITCPLPVGSHLFYLKFSCINYSYGGI